MNSDGKLEDPQRLDRLIEVMHHFHCREPAELEELLELPDDSLTAMFRKRSAALPREVEDGLYRCGVRRAYIRHGSGSMLDDGIDANRLKVMMRHAAHLLKVICRARVQLEGAGERLLAPYHVTDGRQRPTALEEELINLLIEALNDPQTRERLLGFVRKEAENRGRPGPQCMI